MAHGGESRRLPMIFWGFQLVGYPISEKLTSDRASPVGTRMEIQAGMAPRDGEIDDICPGGRGASAWRHLTSTPCTSMDMSPAATNGGCLPSSPMSNHSRRGSLNPSFSSSCSLGILHIILFVFHPRLERYCHLSEPRSLHVLGCQPSLSGLCPLASNPLLPWPCAFFEVHRWPRYRQATPTAPHI